MEIVIILGAAWLVSKAFGNGGEGQNTPTALPGNGPKSVDELARMRQLKLDEEEARRKK